MSLPADWKPCLELVSALALEVTLVVAAAMVVSRRFQQGRWRRLIWQACSLGCLLLLALELMGISPGLMHRIHQGVAGDRSVADAMTAGSAVTGEFPALRNEFRERVAERMEWNRRSLERFGSTTPGDSSLSHVPSPVPQFEAEPFFGGKAFPWPEMIWLIGAVAVFGPMWLSRVLFRSLSRGRRRVIEPELLTRVSELCGRMGVRTDVRMVESPHWPTPLAFGLIHPTIGVPMKFTRDFTEPQQDVMLLHELAHLAGRDPLWQGVADLMAALLWWHPLVWYTRRSLREAAESAADEASSLVSGGPAVLAECLLQFASRLATRREAGFVGMTGTGFRSGLGRRISRLVKVKDSSWQQFSRVRVYAVNAAGLATLVTGALLCTAWIWPQREGGTMQTWKHTWNRSIATLALFTAISSETSQGAASVPQAGQSARKVSTAEIPEIATAPAEANAESPAKEPGLARAEADRYLTDARLLIEMGKYREAAEKLNQAVRVAPKDAEVIRRYQELSRLGTYGTTNLVEIPAKASEAKETDASHIDRMGPRLAPRFGLPLKPSDPAPERHHLDPRLAARYGISTGSRMNLAQANDSEAPDQTTAGRYQMDPQLAARYGLRLPPAQKSATNAHRFEGGKQQVEAKLSQITFPELELEGVSLGDVVRFLQDAARKNDPARKGLNFLISNVLDGAAPGSIDPTTGAPLPISTTMDVSNVNIRLNLRDVRLRDVLDAMTRVAEQPIKYSVEELRDRLFAVWQSFKQLTGYGGPAPEPVRLQVRTFRVDTNTFVPGLESAFGITLAEAQSLLKEPRGTEPPARPRQIQHALRQLLLQLGVDMDVPNKAVFYNDLTGIVMVRATSEDLELVQAALETLGGRALRPGNASQVEGTKRKSVSIIGEVNRAGLIELPEEPIDLLEGIALAGDFKPTANKNKIQLNRDGKATFYKFEDLARAQDSQTRTWLEPGDVVHVHASFF